MKTNRYSGPLATADTTRGPTPQIWYDCPVLDLIEDPSLGTHIFDDFNLIGNADMSSAYKNSIGRWTAYGYAGATLTDSAKEGGVLQLQCDGDDEGMALFSSAGSFRMVTTSTLALNRKLWFEARWARSTITTDKIDCYVGLMGTGLTSGLPTAAIPITTTDDTLATAVDLFGFHSNSNTAVRGGMTEVAAAFNLASGTVNYPTNCTTLMASTGNSVLSAGGFVKTGFLFDPDAPYGLVTVATARQTVGTLRRKLIRFFINGLELPTFLTVDDVVNATAGQAFPTTFMTPVIAMFNTAAAGGSLDIDWIRVAQLANS